MKPVSFIILLLFMGCKTTPPEIFISHENLGIHSYPVNGKFGSKIHQKMYFGPFQTSFISRSWTTNKGSYIPYWTSGTIRFDDYANIVGKEYHNKKQSIYFGLKDSLDNESIAFCITQARSSNILIGKNKNNLTNSVLSLLNRIENGENTYHVRIYLKNEQFPWDLLLDNKAAQQNPENYTGFLYKNETDYYKIVPTNKIRNKNGLAGTIPFGSLGYEIYNTRGEMVAAVSNIGKGKVYLADRNAAEKFVLANLCMSILLQDVI